MGIIRNEEIKRYSFYNRGLSEVVCLDCMNKEDLEDLKENEILTEGGMERSDYKYFCDRCKKEI